MAGITRRLKGVTAPSAPAVEVPVVDDAAADNGAPVDGVTVGFDTHELTDAVITCKCTGGGGSFTASLYWKDRVSGLWAIDQRFGTSGSQVVATGTNFRQLLPIGRVSQVYVRAVPAAGGHASVFVGVSEQGQ